MPIPFTEHNSHVQNLHVAIDYIADEMQRSLYEVNYTALEQALRDVINSDRWFFLDSFEYLFEYRSEHLSPEELRQRAIEDELNS